MNRCDILVIVPLSVEFKVVEQLVPVESLGGKETVYYYKLSFPGVDYEIVALLLGVSGTTNASSMTEKAINSYRPKLIVLIGSAGGLDNDISLGDIVIADEINEFLMDAKAVPQNETYVLKFSGKHWDTATNLVNLARNFQHTLRDRFATWQEESQEFREQSLAKLSRRQSQYLKEKPELYVGHLASGDIVGASQAYKKFILESDRKSLALEMEAAGVAVAAKSRRRAIPLLVLRGISDFSDERKGKLDRFRVGVFRQYAMHNVIKFLTAFLSSGEFENLGRVRPRKIQRVEIGNGKDPDKGTAEAQTENPPSVLLIQSSADKSTLELLQRILNELPLSPGYFQSGPNVEADEIMEQNEFIFWILDDSFLHFDWQHKVGMDLIKQRRKHFVLLMKACELPEQLGVFHTVTLWGSDANEKISLLKNRMFTKLSDQDGNDLFIQALFEELTMGMYEYIKDYPSLEKDPNIFAAMYFSAQCQEYEILLKYIHSLSAMLPGAGFADLEFGRGVRKNLKMILRQSHQIQAFVEIGLSIEPNDSVGRSIKLRCEEIARMAEDDLLPIVEKHLGRSVLPSHFSLQIHKMYTMMDAVAASLRSIQSGLNSVYAGDR